MKKQSNGFYTRHLLATLVALLTSYIGRYFTEWEVDYMLGSIATICDEKGRPVGCLDDPRISWHMYKRFSEARPNFKAAWDAIEESNDDPQKLAAIEKKYGGTARLAALVMDVRSLTCEWRDVSPIKKSEAE